MKLNRSLSVSDNTLRASPNAATTPRIVVPRGVSLDLSKVRLEGVQICVEGGGRATLFKCNIQKLPPGTPSVRVVGLGSAEGATVTAKECQFVHCAECVQVVGSPGGAATAELTACAMRNVTHIAVAAEGAGATLRITGGALSLSHTAMAGRLSAGAAVSVRGAPAGDALRVVTAPSTPEGTDRDGPVDASIWRVTGAGTGLMASAVHVLGADTGRSGKRVIQQRDAFRADDGSKLVLHGCTISWFRHAIIADGAKTAVEVGDCLLERLSAGVLAKDGARVAIGGTRFEECRGNVKSHSGADCAVMGCVIQSTRLLSTALDCFRASMTVDSSEIRGNIDKHVSAKSSSKLDLTGMGDAPTDGVGRMDPSSVYVDPSCTVSGDPLWVRGVIAVSSPGSVSLMQHGRPHEIFGTWDDYARASGATSHRDFEPRTLPIAEIGFTGTVAHFHGPRMVYLSCLLLSKGSKNSLQMRTNSVWLDGQPRFPTGYGAVFCFQEPPSAAHPAGRVLLHHEPMWSCEFSAVVPPEVMDDEELASDPGTRWTRWCVPAPSEKGKAWTGSMVEHGDGSVYSMMVMHAEKKERLDSAMRRFAFRSLVQGRPLPWTFADVELSAVSRSPADLPALGSATTVASEEEARKRRETGKEGHGGDSEGLRAAAEGETGSESDARVRARLEALERGKVPVFDVREAICQAASALTSSGAGNGSWEVLETAVASQFGAGAFSHLGVGPSVQAFVRDFMALEHPLDLSCLSRDLAVALSERFSTGSGLRNRRRVLCGCLFAGHTVSEPVAAAWKRARLGAPSTDAIDLQTAGSAPEEGSMTLHFISVQESLGVPSRHVSLRMAQGTGLRAAREALTRGLSSRDPLMAAGGALACLAWAGSPQRALEDIKDACSAVDEVSAHLSSLMDHPDASGDPRHEEEEREAELAVLQELEYVHGLIASLPVEVVAHRGILEPLVPLSVLASARTRGFLENAHEECVRGLPGRPNSGQDHLLSRLAALECLAEVVPGASLLKAPVSHAVEAARNVATLPETPRRAAEELKTSLNHAMEPSDVAQAPCDIKPCAKATTRDLAADNSVVETTATAVISDAGADLAQGGSPRETVERLREEMGRNEERHRQDVENISQLF